jgi:hypothetical protein
MNKLFVDGFVCGLAIFYWGSTCADGIVRLSWHLQFEEREASYISGVSTPFTV